MPTRRLKFEGQYRRYELPHRLTSLLVRGAGTDPGLRGSASFMSFGLLTQAVYQQFLVYMVGRLLPEYRVLYQHLHVFEDENGIELKDKGFLIPDLQLRDESGGLKLVIDAKYEEHGSGLPAADFYQAHVYGDLLGRKEGIRPLPTVLATPHHELAVLAGRRPLRRLDPRAHRPVTWCLGVPVGKLLGEDETATAARTEFAEALRRLVTDPVNSPL